MQTQATPEQKMRTRQPVVELIDPMVVECLRRLTPAKRLAQAFGLWDFAVLVMRASIRQDHPEWSPEQVQAEISRRMQGSTEP